MTEMRSTHTHKKEFFFRNRFKTVRHATCANKRKEMRLTSASPTMLYTLMPQTQNYANDNFILSITCVSMIERYSRW